MKTTLEVNPTTAALIASGVTPWVTVPEDGIPHTWVLDDDGEPRVRQGSMDLDVHEDRIDCEVCGNSFCVNCGPYFGCELEAGDRVLIAANGDEPDATPMPHSYTQHDYLFVGDIVATKGEVMWGDPAKDPGWALMFWGEDIYRSTKLRPIVRSGPVVEATVEAVMPVVDDNSDLAGALPSVISEDGRLVYCRDRNGSDPLDIEFSSEPMELDVTEQRPFADWSPGRTAIRLTDIVELPA